MLSLWCHPVPCSSRFRMNEGESHCEDRSYWSTVNPFLSLKSSHRTPKVDHIMRLIVRCPSDSDVFALPFSPCIPMQPSYKSEYRLPNDANP